MRLTLLFICALIWTLSCNKNTEEKRAGGSSIQTTDLQRSPHYKKTKDEVEHELFQGECTATINSEYDKDGKLANVNVKVKSKVPGVCKDYDAKGNDAIKYKNLEIVDSAGPITFGDPNGPHIRTHGKITCYGPPIPSPPRCICIHC